MQFFEWAARLAETSPWASGFVVVVTMAVCGLVFALLAEVALKPVGINLGYYKKEYEEDEEEDVKSARVH